MEYEFSDRLTRRKLVRAGIVGGAASLAGCNVLNSDQTDETDTETPSPANREEPAGNVTSSFPDFTVFENIRNTSEAASDVIGSSPSFNWGEPVNRLDQTYHRSPPFFHGGSLFIISDYGTLHRIDPETGDILTSTFLSNAVDGITQAPVQVGNFIFVMDSDAVLYQVNINTMELVWKRDFRQNGVEVPFSSMAYYDSTLYVPHGRFDTSSGGITAISTQTGDIEWSQTGDTLGTVVKPAIHEDTESIITSTVNGFLRSYSAQGGGLNWELEVASSPGPVAAAPIVIGDNIFTSGGPSPLVALLKVRTGEPVWSLNLDGSVSGKPAYSASEQSFFVPTTAGTLYRINLDKTIEWRKQVQNNLTMPVSVVGSSILSGSVEGGFGLLQISDGKTIVTTQYSSPLFTYPIVNDSTLYVAENNIQPANPPEDVGNSGFLSSVSFE